MSSTTNDRAAGAVLGMACGDALGAGDGHAPSIDPGEWTGATAMAVPILHAAAAGESLTGESTQDRIVAAWVGWARAAGEVDDRTRAVFAAMREPTASAARAAARTLHDRTDRPDDHGALVRTAPVALAFAQTGATSGLVRAATQLSALTHLDRTSGEACVLWTGAIHHAIRTGELDVRGRLVLLPEERRAFWVDRLDEAEAGEPQDFERTGRVVEALQTAWSAIVNTAVPEELPGRHLRLALEAAVHGAPGTDAVAAIAGALLGARWGASAIPAEWRRNLHGRPGLRAADLARAAVLAANGGLGDGTGWPAVDRVRPSGPRVLVPHPHDDGVLLGTLAALDDLPAGIDAVVSLCRVGRRQTDREQVEFWLVDQPGRNPNLDLVLHDAVDTIAVLRAEGKRVLVHCAEGRSRTPAVGALYATVHLGISAGRALAEVTAALPDGAPAPFLQEAVLRIGEAYAADPPRPVLFVDLDTAMLDVRSGIERLPASARTAHLGRLDEAPGLVGLMDPLPGAVAAFHRLADAYDAYLLAPPPWPGSTAWQHRLDWVALHFGVEETDATGAPNPAYRRLVLADRAVLPRGAVLVDGRDEPDGFEGERLLLGADPFPSWQEALVHLLAPERTGRLPRPGRQGRSRDRTAGRPSLTAWLLESLRAHGGAASPIQVARDIQHAHEDELSRSGDLAFTWQHDLRRVASRLRDEGRLAPSSDGVWRLAR